MSGFHLRLSAPLTEEEQGDSPGSGGEGESPPGESRIALHRIHLRRRINALATDKYSAAIDTDWSTGGKGDAVPSLDDMHIAQVLRFDRHDVLNRVPMPLPPALQPRTRHRSLIVESCEKSGTGQPRMGGQG